MNNYQVNHAALEELAVGPKKRLTNAELVKPTKADHLSRQAIRGMLFEKAKWDITVRYGIVTEDKHLAPLFRGFDPCFPRRVRRLIAKALAKKWHKQLKLLVYGEEIHQKIDISPEQFHRLVKVLKIGAAPTEQEMAAGAR